MGENRVVNPAVNPAVLKVSRALHVPQSSSLAGSEHSPHIHCTPPKERRLGRPTRSSMPSSRAHGLQRPLAALALVLALCGHHAACYYVPGTYPQEFRLGDPIQGAIKFSR